MNRRQKRWLMRNAKITVACLGMLYLAVGVRAVGTEGSSCRLETKAQEMQTIEVDRIVEIEEEPHIILEAAPEEVTETTLVASRDWGAEDSYLLAKIAMAEAESEDLEGKALVIMTVLNRVWSDGFPDSIEEVIFQYNEISDVYQFSVMQPGGRWWTTEPNEECWEAVEMVQTEQWDESRGATYFESEGKSEWHQNNLEFLFKHGNHYFYTDKEK